MVRPHTSYRILAALVLLAVLGVVFVSLGNWQLRRAAERTAIRESIEAGRASAPLDLRGDTPDGALRPWRPATAQGTWRHDLTVLLENRNHEGRPGYWVATPLLMDDGVAVLVLRGWLPRFTGASGAPAAPQVPSLPGEQHVTGELLERVPRLFELAAWAGGGDSTLPGHLPQADGAPPIIQNLDLADYAAATGLKLVPAVLAQTVAPRPPKPDAALQPGASMVYDWPEPSIDADQNRGYALQWFGFATIAALAWIVIAWRALRRPRKP